jgi:hypothetical protein
MHASFLEFDISFNFINRIWEMKTLWQNDLVEVVLHLIH